MRAHAIKLRPGEVRFFARIITADLACPRCDRVVRLGASPYRRVTRRAQVQGPRGGHIRDAVWDARTCRFCCPGCGLVLLLGILAHQVVQRTHGSRQPPDTVPDWKQVLQLRRELSTVSTKKKLTGETVNELREDLEGEPEEPDKAE